MKASLLLMGLAFTSLTLYSQNQLDELGRKTGPWKMEYPNGNIRYEGTFRDGMPIGMMTRYYESGELSAEIRFSPSGDRSKAVLYYKRGKKAAEGIFNSQQKDSLWIYYSEYDGTVRIKENYKKGNLDGVARRFYPDGGISEEVSWSDGQRHGSWIQYFEDGSQRLKGFYRNDKLHGDYQVWGPENELLMSGRYEDGKSTGTWNYFDAKGNLLYSLEYRDGIPVDMDRYLEIMQDTLLQQDSIPEAQPFQLF